MKMIFRRMFAFTARLQWKLTLSYTLVTVVVLTLLMIATVFIGNVITYNYVQSTQLMANALSASAANLTTALQSSPPDVEQIQQWVDKNFQGSSILINGSGEENYQTFTSAISKETILAVLDAQGKVLASNHPEQLQAGALIAPVLPSDGKVLLARAQEGETRISQLLVQADLQQLAIAPIRTEDGQLLGMVFLLLERPGQLAMLWLSLISILPVIGIAAVPAALIGMLFGVLTARGLTARLKKATQTTAAWGQGDFSVRITDPSQDEIGQLARDLNHMADHLQELMRTRQELAALEERNRLARELHDSAKQQVFATSMNLAAVKALWDRNPEEARKRLEIATELSRSSQHELTTLIQTLRPPQLNRHSLPQAICQAARDCEKQSGIRMTCQVKEINRQLSPELEQALFRVVQEGLSNIQRHSEATAAEISLDPVENAIFLQLQDNGHGFDPQQPARGLGLRSMHERMIALGGTLQITSAATGTCLTARVPFEEENQHARPDHHSSGR